MKIIYVTFLNEDIKPGYKNKIHSQCEALTNLGHNVFLYIVKNDCIALYDFDKTRDKIISEYPTKKRLFQKRNIIDEFFLFDLFINNLSKIIDIQKPDVLYIRRIIPINFKLLNALEECKKKNIKIIYEYPTYPWETEMIRGKSYLFYLIDKLLYAKLIETVDKIAYIGEGAGLNEKFVQFSNAAPVSKVKIKVQKKSDNVLNLVGVAHVAHYHGYDRIIRGLHEYYASNPSLTVIFNIVGPVNKRLGLEKMVLSLGLENRVNFLGFKYGKDLDNIFDENHIGIAGLGSHRKKNSITSSLKSREYAARGIPFILSVNDDILEQQNPDFIYKFPADDTPINIFEIINFYYNNKSSAKEIREFAENYLSWEPQMDKIIKSL